MLDRYIVDFYCEEKRLAIELDGPHHRSFQNVVHDFEKDFELEKSGVRTLRIHNFLVQKRIEQVLGYIALIAKVGEFAQDSTPNGFGELLVPVEKWKTFADTERQRLLNGDSPAVPTIEA